MIRIAAAVVLVTIAGSAVFGVEEGAPGFKVGDTIVVMQDTELKIDDRVVQKVYRGFHYPIRVIEGDRLLVGDRHLGWLERRCVVPLERAIPALTELIRQNPEDAGLHNARGLVRTATLEYDQALADFDKAVRLGPSAPCYMNRGNVWMRKGIYPEAIANFNAALRLDPKNAGAYGNRGNAWLYRGEYDRAIADFDEVTRLDPRDALSFHNRGIAWRSKGEYAKAIADLSVSIQLNPHFGMAYGNRGIALNLSGEYEKALADFDQADRLTPRNPAVYANRGISRAGMREHDKAIADFSEAIRLNLKTAAIFDLRGDAWNAQGAYDEAVSDYSEALRLDPKHVDACNSLAWIMATCADERRLNGPKAVELATRACELSAWKVANNVSTLAAAYAETGNYPEAVKWQVKAVELAPAAKKADFATHVDRYLRNRPFRQTSEE